MQGARSLALFAGGVGWAFIFAAQTGPDHSPGPQPAALRRAVQVYRRAQRAGEGERYEAIGDFESQPGPADITEAFKQASKLSKAW